MRRSTSGSVSGSTPHGGVEVPLHGDSAAEALTSDVDGHPPVDADDVGSGVGHERQQLAGVDAEVDGRHVEIGKAVEDFGAGGQHAPLIVVGAEGAGPAVEQLHGRGPGVDLHPEERARDVGQR